MDLKLYIWPLTSGPQIFRNCQHCPNKSFIFISSWGSLSFWVVRLSNNSKCMSRIHSNYQRWRKAVSAEVERHLLLIDIRVQHLHYYMMPPKVSFNKDNRLFMIFISPFSVKTVQWANSWWPLLGMHASAKRQVIQCTVQREDKQYLTVAQCQGNFLCNLPNLVWKLGSNMKRIWNNIRFTQFL